MAFDLDLEFILPCKPRRTMQLLTDAKLIRKWSGGDAIVENMVGGRFAMFDGWVTGKVLKLGLNDLAYTWISGDWPAGTPASEVHYQLKDYEAGTRVLVKHTNFPSEEEMNSHKTGWSEYFFDPMEDYIMAVDRT